MKLAHLVLYAFMATTLVECSSSSARFYGGLFIFTSAIITALNREYGMSIREFLQVPRMPLLLPAERELRKCSLGDVLINEAGDLFFFVSINGDEFETCDIISLADGILHRNYLLSGLRLVKEVNLHEQKLIHDQQGKYYFRVIQQYNDRCLLFSNTHKSILVSDVSDLDNSLDVFIKAKSCDSDSSDFLKSPDSISQMDDLYSLSNLVSLFRIQPSSPELAQVRMNFIKRTLVPHLKSKSPLPKAAISTLFNTAKYLFANDKRIISIEAKVGESFTIVGDIHGQFSDLLRILRMQQFPSETNKFLFNGDIVDRGQQSCACLFLLLALKIALPDSVFINRGNHESNHCGKENFYREMYEYDPTEKLYLEALEMFHFMPSAHILNKTAFIVHGGIPENFDINAYNASPRPPFGTIDWDEFELLWNDPSEELGMTTNSHRGGASAKMFGPDVTKDFLNRHNLQLIIRSHLYTNDGRIDHHDGQCYTVFSAPNYCGVAKNEAAIISVTVHSDHIAPRFIHFK